MFPCSPHPTSWVISSKISKISKIPRFPSVEWAAAVSAFVARL